MPSYSDARFLPEKAALIVVDVQNDFCHPEGVSAQKGNDVSAAVEMAPRLQTLIARAREEGMKVVFIQTTHDLTVDSPVWNTRAGDVDVRPYQPNCATGTWGADFYVVDPLPGENVVVKHRYSAFAGTDLDVVLRTAGIESLLFTGVATNVCVESTLRDGLFLDYHVSLVEDCCAAYAPELHAGTVRNVQSTFGAVVTGDRLAAIWDAQAQAIAA
ncbi:cysteine hydrolase family protein [Microbacterium tumbae]